MQERGVNNEVVNADDLVLISEIIEDFKKFEIRRKYLTRLKGQHQKNESEGVRYGRRIVQQQNISKWSLWEKSNNQYSVVHKMWKLGSRHKTKKVTTSSATRFICSRSRRMMDSIEKLCDTDREREREIHFLKSGFVCVNACGRIHLMFHKSLYYATTFCRWHLPFSVQSDQYIP